MKPTVENTDDLADLMRNVSKRDVKRIDTEMSHLRLWFDVDEWDADAGEQITASLLLEIDLHSGKRWLIDTEIDDYDESVVFEKR